MPFRKVFSGPKPEEPPPYAGSLYPAQNHGATAPLSPMFRPSSSSPPLGPPWQTPLAQGQASNGLPNQSYFAPPPGTAWQALGQDFSRAPSTSTFPPAQHQINSATHAPSPYSNQIVTDPPSWTVATQAENRVATRPGTTIARMTPPPLPPRMPSSEFKAAITLSAHTPSPQPSANTYSPFTRAPAAIAIPQRLPGKLEPPKVRKILSLDGGGVRGLSIIMILKYLMKNLNRQRGTILQPWQEFDMIGGTSTGGIIAIMLGRLRMSLDECEEAYKTLSKKVFSATTRGSANPRRMYDFLKANGKFDERPLEESIRDTLLGRNLAENELLQERGPDACRVFVCATRAENSAPAVLRSYESSRNDPFYDICQIWEAVRATSAASTFFEPIQIGPNDETFVDGAFRRNNPIRVASMESRSIWPQADLMFVSVGTGSAPGKSLLGDLKELAQRLSEIALDTEQTNRDFRAENPGLVQNGRLYRFNVTDGSMASIGIEEYQAAAKIAAFTNSHLDDPDVTESVEKCVQNLRSGGQRLGYASLEELEIMMAAAKLREVIAVLCSSCYGNISYEEIYYECRICNTNLCNTCQGSHMNGHLIHLVRFVTISWAATNSVEPESSCVICSRQVKCRIECTECLTSICNSCYCDNREARELYHKDHGAEHPRHKSFRDISPPFMFKKPLPRDKSCPCFDTHEIVGHCSRCSKATRIGETAIQCDTCIQEYGATQEVCSECFASEPHEHTSTHQFFHISTQKAVNLPDDPMTQFQSLFQCNSCSLVTGPEMPYFHEHKDLKMCIGDAALDTIRKNIVKSGCIKMTGVFSKLKDPPDPTQAGCTICTKKVGFDVWNLICLQCDEFFCKACVDAGRYAHRHAANWCRIVKKSASQYFVLGMDINCDLCSKTYYANSFTGLHCVSCNNFDYCFTVCVKGGKMPKEHAYCGGKLSSWELRLIV